jgi:hypothetical protein
LVILAESEVTQQHTPSFHPVFTLGMESIRSTITSMKTTLILIGLLLAGLITARADTNNTAGPTQTNLLGAVTNSVSVPPQVGDGLSQIWQAASNPTNFAIVIGGGRSMHKNYNLLFVDYVYDVATGDAGSAGLVLGFDDIAKGTKFTTDDVGFVKGGLNLKTEIQPLKQFGWGLKVTPFTDLLVCSGSGGKVGTVWVAGANYRINIGKGWMLNIGGFYENRFGSGQDSDTSYLCGNLAVSKGF